jgi:RNA polymerase primary sigma factor
LLTVYDACLDGEEPAAEAKNATCYWQANLPTVEQELQWVILARNGCTESKQKLIGVNMRLVASFARRFSKHGLHHEDLVQEGIIGLISAIDKYDPTRGFRFSPYAMWHVRNAMSQAIENNSRTIRVPDGAREFQVQVVKTFATLGKELGRKPTINEVAASMGTNLEVLTQSFLSLRGSCSLEEFYDANQPENPILDWAEDRTQNREEEIISRLDLQYMLENSLHVLNQLERQVVVYHYGLLDGMPRSYADIGRELNLTRERIRQIEFRAIRRLRLRHTLSGYLS